MDRNVVVGTATKASDQNYSVKLVEDDDYTGLDTDKYDEIWGNPTDDDYTYTLPTSADNPNRIITVRHIGDGTYDFDIAPDGADTIGGYAANFKLNGVGQFVSLIADPDNSNWRVGPCLGTLLEFTSVSQTAIGSPTSSTWYNPTGHSLSITPGIWNVSRAIEPYAADTNASIQAYSTLSTANNSETDVLWSCRSYAAPGASAAIGVSSAHYKTREIIVATTTVFYQNIMGIGSGALASLIAMNNLAGAFIQARRIA